MCLSSMQDDSTSRSWNLASKDKWSSVIFDRLLYFRVSIFVQISRNKLGQKKYQGALVSLVLEQHVTATVCVIAAVPGLLGEENGSVCPKADPYWSALFLHGKFRTD